MSNKLLARIREEYCTLAEAAGLLAVSTVTLWRWIRDGKIAAERLGREVLIARSDIEKMKRK